MPIADPRGAGVPGVSRAATTGAGAGRGSGTVTAGTAGGGGSGAAMVGAGFVAASVDRSGEGRVASATVTAGPGVGGGSGGGRLEDFTRTDASATGDSVRSWLTNTATATGADGPDVPVFAKSASGSGPAPGTNA